MYGNEIMPYVIFVAIPGCACSIPHLWDSFTLRGGAAGFHSHCCIALHVWIQQRFLHLTVGTLRFSPLWSFRKCAAMNIPVQFSLGEDICIFLGYLTKDRNCRYDSSYLASVDNVQKFSKVMVPIFTVPSAVDESFTCSTCLSTLETVCRFHLLLSYFCISVTCIL